MLSNVHLIACGSNAAGQLGTDDLEDHHTFRHCSFIGVPQGETPPGTTRILDVACGACHTIALLERVSDRDRSPITELWACGDGIKGQLGPAEFIRQSSADFERCSSTVFRPVHFGDQPAIREVIGDFRMKPKLVAAAWQTSYVVFAGESQNDVVVSMGVDDWGCLGIGNEASQNPARTGQANLVDLSPWTPRNGRLEVRSIKSSQHHVIAQLTISEDNHKEKVQEVLVGWGKSRHGQLGGQNLSEAKNPKKGKQKAKDSLYVSSPRFIGRSTRSTSRFALGAHHSVFFDMEGNLTGSGCNKKGQQNVLHELKERRRGNINDFDCTWNGTYVLYEEGGATSILASGGWEKGQLGRTTTASSNTGKTEFPEGFQPRSIACGSEHVLALCEQTATSGTSSHVLGWGWNEHGNLGIGGTSDVEIPVHVWPSNAVDSEGTTLCGVWAGAATSWISFQQIK